MHELLAWGETIFSLIRNSDYGVWRDVFSFLWLPVRVLFIMGP